MTRAITGSESEVSQTPGEDPGLIWEVESNHPSWTAKIVTRKTPMMNPGSALPATAPTWTTRSIQPRRTAAATPSTVASTAMIATEANTITSVTMRREPMASKTGWLVNHERPKSSWTAWDIQSPSWVRRGWSSPSSACLAAICSSVAWSPRMFRAMLPEPAKRRVYASTETTTRTTRPDRILRAMSLSMV
jgi:hypothetical protein